MKRKASTTAEPDVFVQATRIRHRRFPKTFLEAIGVLQAFQDLCQSQVTRYPRGHVLHHPTLPPCCAASRGMLRVRLPSYASKAARR